MLNTMSGPSPIFGRYALQVGDGNLAVLLRHWRDYDKPCDLIFKKPHGKGYTGVIVNIQSLEQADWLEALVRTHRFPLHKLNDKTTSK